MPAFDQGSSSQWHERIPESRKARACNASSERTSTIAWRCDLICFVCRRHNRRPSLKVARSSVRMRGQKREDQQSSPLVPRRQVIAARDGIDPRVNVRYGRYYLLCALSGISFSCLFSDFNCSLSFVNSRSVRGFIFS